MVWPAPPVDIRPYTVTVEFCGGTALDTQAQISVVPLQLHCALYPDTCVGVGVGADVLVGVGVMVGVDVFVGVGVMVGVFVCVGVIVGVAVLVGVGVLVDVEVLMAAGTRWLNTAGKLTLGSVGVIIVCPYISDVRCKLSTPRVNAIAMLERTSNFNAGSSGLFMLPRCLCRYKVFTDHLCEIPMAPFLFL